MKPFLLHYSPSVTCLCQPAIYLAFLEEAENLFFPSGYLLCLTHCHCIYCKVRNSRNNPWKRLQLAGNSLFSFSGINGVPWKTSSHLSLHIWRKCMEAVKYSEICLVRSHQILLLQVIVQSHCLVFAVHLPCQSFNDAEPFLLLALCSVLTFNCWGTYQMI